ncbi:helix-turn-helix domain-containing protein [Nonomuraea sp. NPDC049141]|uniref:helix-turn-helix domain-containing protein n=1 Tax=Nonomuraea sp. NPDC049141 TaxID=3155500 RepID=UPI0033C9EDF4
MTDRWAVERALLTSGLPSQARLIVFVLLTHVSQGTLVVPSKYAPSFTGLVKETGLSRGSLSKYMNQLEEDGWVERNRPTTKEAIADQARTGYRVQLPSGVVQHTNQFSTRTSSGDERAEQEDLFTAGTPGEPVQDTNGARSGAEHKSNVGPTSSSLTEKKGGAGGSQGQPKKRTRAKKPTPVDDPNFVAFYAAMPRKQDPDAAARAWAEIVANGVPTKDLILAAEAYRDDPTRNGLRTYIKTPRNFLVDGRYKQYLPNCKNEDEDVNDTERAAYRDYD